VLVRRIRFEHEAVEVIGKPLLRMYLGLVIFGALVVAVSVAVMHW
jgi:hypothetical protein